MDKNIEEKKYKYSILHELKRLSIEECEISKNKLNIVLGISESTLKMWMYIPIISKRQIPTNKLAIIAKYLKVGIEDLLNEPIPNYNYEDLKALELTNDKEDFKIQ